MVGHNLILREYLSQEILYLVKCMMQKCIKHLLSFYSGASQVAQWQRLPANAGDSRDMGLIPGSGRSPGGGNGRPLLYSYLENSIDRGAQSMGLQRVKHD